jgi:hypothetical protein
MIKDDHKVPNDGKLKSTSDSLRRTKSGPVRGIGQPKETSMSPKPRDEGSHVGNGRIPTDYVVSSPVTDYDPRLGPRDAYPNHDPTLSLVSTAIPGPNMSPHNEFSSFQPLNTFQASHDSSLLNQHHHIDANQLVHTINMGETGHTLLYDNGNVNWNISPDFPDFSN